jgi:hypothetical protein
MTQWHSCELVEVPVRRFVPFTTGTVAVIGLTAAFSATPSAGLGATSRPSQVARPAVASAPLGQTINAAGHINSLNAVSSSGGWAVGFYTPVTRVHSLIEHWNGQGWSVVPSPNPGRNGSELLGVAAVSSSEAWAVGDSSAFGGGAAPVTQRTLIEHWNGSAWKQVTSPNVAGASIQSRLLGVAVVSRRSAWAVGSYISTSGTAGGALIEHWNGRAWKIVKSPKLRGGLEGVAAVSSSSVWAVGAQSTGTLVEHWNGRAWKVVPSPNRGSSGSNLLAVAAVSSRSAWAVGISVAQTVQQTLIEHWNGRVWKVVPSPNPAASSGAGLSAVAAASSRNVWAVGSYSDVTANLTLIEHWNGHAWTQVPSPDPGGTTVSAGFSGVAAISSRSAWAVGSYFATRVRHPKTLIAHWDGHAWTQVPSPNR